MDWKALLWSSRRKKILIVSIGLCLAFVSFANTSPISPIKKQYKKSKPVSTEVEQFDPIKKINTSDVSTVQTLLRAASNQANVTKKEEISRGLGSSPAEPVRSNIHFAPNANDLSTAQKKAMIEDLTREEPIESPFEITQDDVDTFEQFLEETDPEKKDALRKVVTMYPETKNKDQPNKTTSTSVASGTTGLPTSSGRSKSASASITASVNEEQDGGTDEAASNNLQYGEAITKREDYQEVSVELPQELQAVYDHIRVYEVNAGNQGNADLVAYSDHQRFPIPLYQALPEVGEKKESDSNQKLEKKYRFPPEWNNYDKFHEDPIKGAKIATTLSQKLVLSLGMGGSITFEVVGGKIANGDGPDFVIWENPFCFFKTVEGISRVKQDLYKTYLGYKPFSLRTNQMMDEYVDCTNEVAEISVSVDGSKNSFKAFKPCVKPKRGEKPSPSSRCGGYGYNAWRKGSSSFDYLKYGGDQYDLSELGFEEVRFVKIKDLGFGGDKGQAGFDLDAFAVVNFEEE